MFGFDEGQEHYDKVYDQSGGYNDPPPENEAHFSHELIAGAASFAGMKMFEDHQRKEGKTVSHAFAKELLAGFAGGEVDKLAETHGMNEVDKVRAHHRAKENARELYDQHYVQEQGADQYDPNQYGPPQAIERRFGGYN